MRCPHCDQPINVRLIKAPAMQADSVLADDRAIGNDVGALLERIHDEDLETGFEVKFIRETRERFEKYGDRILMSERQMNVLRKIAAK